MTPFRLVQARTTELRVQLVHPELGEVSMSLAALLRMARGVTTPGQDEWCVLSVPGPELNIVTEIKKEES